MMVQYIPWILRHAPRDDLLGQRVLSHFRRHGRPTTDTKSRPVSLGFKKAICLGQHLWWAFCGAYDSLFVCSLHPKETNLNYYVRGTSTWQQLVAFAKSSNQLLRMLQVVVKQWNILVERTMEMLSHILTFSAYSSSTLPMKSVKRSPW